MIKFTKEDSDRFDSYVDKLPNGCHFWTGGRSRGDGNRKWYGSFWVGGKTVRAHRFACDRVGKICPPGHHRDHTCCFSMCVNEAHIEIVTHAENELRKKWRRLMAETEAVLAKLDPVVRAGYDAAAMAMARIVEHCQSQERDKVS